MMRKAKATYSDIEMDINEAITLLESMLYKRKPTESDMDKVREAIRILKK